MYIPVPKLPVMKFVLVGAFLSLFLHVYAQDQKTLVTNMINEERFIAINGMEQWITIKGDSTRPIVLFLHGGPGSPLSPYSDAIFGHQEKDLLLVQWDQRGTGRTYGRNAPEELTPEFLKSNPLSVHLVTTDGLELSKYLLQRFKQSGIILFATSWGSVPGINMITRNPELFHAYIAHSQVVNFNASLLSAYNQVYQMAGNARDQATVSKLDSIGKPPYGSARTTGQLMRVIKNYQEKNTILPPAAWFELPGRYNNEKDNQHRSDGDDYSFVNYAGDKRLGIEPMSAAIDFLQGELTFKIPVYFIQGANDIQTPLAITKKFYEKIMAPTKKIFILEDTGHGFNQRVIDAQYKIMLELLSLINNK